MDKATLQAGFRFEEFRVFPDRGEIRDDGGTRRLEPRVMDVLVLLAAHEGQVVSRDTLIEEVWRGALISDDVISRCIYQLRKELGERGRELIKTVPKRGYRLRGTIAPIDESSPTPTPDTESPARPTESRRRSATIFLLALAVVAITAGYYIASPSSPTAEHVTIAVSAFTGNSAEDDDILGPGVAEGLLYRLSRNPALTVLARASSFQPSDDLKEALPDSKLAVIEGEITRQGTEWLLDVRLVDAGTGGEIWRTRLTTEDLPMSEIENRVELGILQALNAIPDGLTLPGTGFASDDLEAYRSFLRGRELIHKRTPESMQEAMSLFSTAAALDPDYAAAYAAFAEVSAHMSIYAGRNWADYREAARASIERALALDPDSAYAHAVMGLVHFADDNMPLAEPALRKSIELNPGFAEAYAWLGLVYMDAGRMEEALDIHKTSALLSPLSSTAQMNIGMAHQSLGRFAEAIRHYEKAIDITPDYGNAYWAAAYACWRRGVLSRAIVLFRQADELGLVSADFFSQYALAHFDAGLHDAGRDYTDRANSIDPTRLWSIRASWARHVIAGDLDNLIERFRKLEEGNSPGTSMPLNLARGYALLGQWRDASSLYETHYRTSDPWFFYHWDAEWGVSHGLMLAVVR
ncbi:MAG: tetratricopeptide repeat protein, partial [Woeseiaceae bacterium]|nr:tetratricopeptide repeat protein [Woeseiaceae bacterium]